MKGSNRLSVNRQLDRQWIAMATIFIVTCLTYLPALRLEWIWDDDQYVTENVLLRSLEGLYRIWFEPSASPQYYPAVFSVFWLEYQLFGLNPAVFHGTNIVLHAITGCLVYRIVLGLKVQWPFWIALAFAVLPMQVESVAWVTELKNVLSGLLYATAWLVLWPTLGCEEGSLTEAKSNDRQLRVSKAFIQPYFAGAALFLLALLSKSVTASLPAGMLVALWFRHGKVSRRAIAMLLPLLIVGAAMGWNTARLERMHVGAEGADWNYGMLDRVGIAAHCLVHYAWQLVLPLEQVFFYKRASTSFWDPVNQACLIFCGVTLAVLIVLAMLKQRGPLAACLYFGGSAFPALGFLNVYPHRFSFVADHFVYFPIVSLLCLWFGGLAWSVEKLFMNSAPRFAWLLPFSLCTWYSLANVAYQPVYTNEITLWRDTLAKNPDCPAAMQNLGLRLVERGDAERALEVLTKATEYDFDRFQTYNSLAVVYKALGRYADARMALEKSLELKRNNAKAWTNYAALVRVEGMSTQSSGWRDKAMQMYLNAWEIRPSYLAAFGLATLSAEAENWAAAEQWFQRALSHSPNDMDAMFNRAYALIRMGRTSEADLLCDEMIRQNPGDREVLSLQNQIRRAGKSP